MAKSYADKNYASASVVSSLNGSVASLNLYVTGLKNGTSSISVAKLTANYLEITSSYGYINATQVSTSSLHTDGLWVNGDYYKPTRFSSIGNSDYVLAAL